MTKTTCKVICLILAILVQPTFAGDGDGCVSVEVIPLLGANFFGSPSFDGFSGNAMDFLQDGTAGPDYDLDSTGFLADPGFIPVEEIIATSFPSWRGEAPGQFAGETGNRAYFGLRVESDPNCPDFQPGALSLDGVSGSLQWLDPDQSPSDIIPNPTVNFSLFNETYTDLRVGVSYGADMMPGGGDDIVYNSGEAGSTPVDAIYYLGASDSLVFGNDVIYDPNISDQDNIDNLVTAFLDPVHPLPQELTTEYTIVNNNGVEYCGKGSVFVPEPAGLQLILGFAGFLAFVGRRRRVA